MNSNPLNFRLLSYSIFFLQIFFFSEGMMRVATDAQQQRLHLPIRMMSGRQWTEQRKFTIKIK